MGSSSVRNRRSIKRISKRRLYTAANFFKFSPTLLHLRLLPGWVFLSLVANGVLLAVLLVLVVRSLSVGSSSPASAIADPSSAPATQANLASLTPSSTPSGPRHQLSYEQWKDLLAQEAKVAAEQNPERLMILAGDSISLWFPENLLPPEQTWLNQAISGETSVGLLERLDLFDQTQPEVIWVMIGINDLLRGTDDQTLLANQQQIIQYLLEAHPQAQIVVQSILPHAADKATWEGRDRLLEISNSRIQAINRQLELIAQEEGVFFLDLYPLFADDRGNLRMEFSTDGLHLNPEGYGVWSIALQVYSHEILEPEATLSDES